jgi:hypothetical protein
MERQFGMMVLISLLACGTGQATQAQETTASVDPAEIERAQPLTAPDLLRIYGGNSWIWGDGAGYFARSPREFFAYVGEGESGSIAKGSWTITDSGRLCMIAQWDSMGSSVDDRTCFAHRQAGQTIYQRKEPDGEWYVMRATPPAETDEFNKIEEGNAVAAAFEEIEKAIR